MIKILILGKNGQVGRELQRTLQRLGRVISCGRDQADFEKPSTLRSLIKNFQPNVIVNAAAYTSVDQAELEPLKAHRINADAARVLAEEAVQCNALLVSYSTDYIFDGKKTGYYSEKDLPCPINQYGVSKLAGEQEIVKSGCQYLIFRIGWVYSLCRRNFLLGILQQAAKQKELSVVNDQFGIPTSSSCVADVTAICLDHVLNHGLMLRDRIYHLSAAGDTSRYEFACFIVRMAGMIKNDIELKPENIYPISSCQWRSPACRPANSRLDTSLLERTFGVVLPGWKSEVIRLIQNYFIS